MAEFGKYKGVCIHLATCHPLTVNPDSSPFEEQFIGFDRPLQVGSSWKHHTVFSGREELGDNQVNQFGIPAIGWGLYRDPEHTVDTDRRQYRPSGLSHRAGRCCARRFGEQRNRATPTILKLFSLDTRCDRERFCSYHLPGAAAAGSRLA